MKQSRLLLSTFIMMFLIAACTKEATDKNPVQDLNSVQNSVDLSHVDFKSYFNNQQTTGENKTNTIGDVLETGTGSVVGTCKLRRSSNNISVNFKAENAPNLDVSGHAVTLWALVWESPADAFSGGHPYAMYRVAGHVVGNNDKLNISGSLTEGQTADYYSTGMSSTTLVDAENAFFLFIAKSHGEMDPAEMPGQINTFNGGCDGDTDGGGPDLPCYEYALAFPL